LCDCSDDVADEEAETEYVSSVSSCVGKEHVEVVNCEFFEVLADGEQRMYCA
jgi:hypothetical protein